MAAMLSKVPSLARSLTMMSADEQSSAFSASGEEAIARTIDASSTSSARRPESSSVAEFYEIDRTAEAILKGDFKRVRSRSPSHEPPLNGTSRWRFNSQTNSCLMPFPSIVCSSKAWARDATCMF